MLDRLLRQPRRLDLTSGLPGSVRIRGGSADAGDEAAAYAAELRARQPPPGWNDRSWPPSTAAAAVDRRTGNVYRGHSAEPDVDVPPTVRKRLPISEEPWPADNCGEVKAASRAVENGANLDDLQIAAVYGKSGRPRVPCRNCEQWIPGGGGRHAAS